MFTGIIETMGTIVGITPQGSNLTFSVESGVGAELKVDQSVAHNGVCLTVTSVQGNVHTVTAIAETLHKTNLGTWALGAAVNIERCLSAQGRFDGHFVQGHVDTTVQVLNIEDQNGSWLITLSLPAEFAHLVIEKGSVCLNGISLTAFGVTDASFQVAIIPYTWHHTNIHTWAAGTVVNVEWDIMGKYLERWRTLGRVS